ncbi:M28 family peptidase [bacterium]|nr:M28 family peptidase [bacterium]
MKKIYTILPTILIGLLFSSNVIQKSVQIDIQNIRTHLNFLGSDSLQGRLPGSPGSKKASEYIANSLLSSGLTPIGNDNSFFQEIPLHASKALTSSEMKLFSPDGRIENLLLKKDFVLFKSGAQTFIPNPIPVIFVGYGIAAPEFDYNDYQSVDVEGKIVVFLGGEPVSNDSSFFDGTSPSIYSFPETKQKIALARGARGSILIPNINQDIDFQWSHIVKDFSFEDISLTYAPAGNLCIMMNPNSAQKLFDDAPTSLVDVFKLEESHQIKSFDLNTQLSFRGEFAEKDFIENNIVGLIEGTDPKLKDSYVLVTAHYDHLGIGPAVNGDSIYDGVVDNASGVAVTLELARFLSINKPKRSVVFLFVTGEEFGLLGSFYYIDHPVVPLYKTVANVNIDGVAIFDTFNDVVGIGSEISDLGTMLKDMLKRNNMNLSSIPEPFLQSESFSRSDNYAFAQAGIPSILIMDGLNHKHDSYENSVEQMITWALERYHSPFDDLSQPINYDAIYQHTELLEQFITLISNSSKTPSWKPGSSYINARLQSIAEKK